MAVVSINVLVNSTSVSGLFYHDIETFVISYLIIPVQIKWLSVPFLLCRLSSPLLLFYGIEIGLTSKDLFQIFCPYFLCCLFFLFQIRIRCGPPTQPEGVGG